MHLGAASGLSHDKKEWLNPRMIIARECSEEMLVTCQEDDVIKMVEPDYKKDNILELDRLNEITSEQLKKQWEKYRKYNFYDKFPSQLSEEMKKIWTTEGKYYSAKSEIISLGKDRINIRRGEREETTSKDLLAINPERGTVEVIGCVLMKFNCTIDKLRFFDGETKSKEEFLLRDIFLFKPLEFSKLFIPGKKITAYRRFKYGLIWSNEQGKPWSSEFDKGKEWNFLPNPKIYNPLFCSGIPLIKRINKTYGIEGLKESDLKYLSNAERHYIDLEIHE